MTQMPEPPANPSTVDGLLNLLASTVRLYLTTGMAHWNVVGPSFFEVHRALGKHYEALGKDADCIAERIRALGEVISISTPPIEIEADQDPASSLRTLLGMREEAIALCGEVYASASASGDIATAVIMEDLSKCHEKVAWLYRSFLAL